MLNYTEFLNEYLTNDGVSLLKYFSMSDAEKQEELISEFYYLLGDFLRERNIEYVSTMSDIDGDIEIDIDDANTDDLPQELRKKFGEWLLNKTENYDLPIPDEDYPAWFYLSNPKLIKNQWLIHFTDEALDIAKNGFKYGAFDISKLGLTTYLSDSSKKYGGYNFAYLLSDFVRYGRKGRYSGGNEYKYGNECVVFKASGVRLYHSTDEEPQVVFYGDTASNIIPILEGQKLKYGIYTVKTKTRDLIYESDDLENMTNWIVKNSDQYRNDLYFKNRNK
jgi:hypothetical protein